MDVKKKLLKKQQQQCQLKLGQNMRKYRKYVLSCSALCWMRCYQERARRGELLRKHTSMLQHHNHNKSVRKREEAKEIINLMLKGGKETKNYGEKN